MPPFNLPPSSGPDDTRLTSPNLVMPDFLAASGLTSPPMTSLFSGENQHSGMQLKPLEVGEIAAVLTELALVREGGTTVSDRHLQLLLQIGITFGDTAQTNKAIKTELLTWARTTQDLRALACVITGWVSESAVDFGARPAHILAQASRATTIPGETTSELPPIDSPTGTSANPSAKGSTRYRDQLLEALRVRADCDPTVFGPLIHLGATPLYKNIRPEPLSPTPVPSYVDQLNTRNIYGQLPVDQLKPILVALGAFVNPDSMARWLEVQYQEHTGLQTTVRTVVSYGSLIYGFGSPAQDMDIYALVEGNCPKALTLRRPHIFRQGAGKIEVQIRFMSYPQLCHSTHDLTKIANLGIVLAGHTLVDVPKPIYFAGSQLENRLAFASDLLTDARTKNEHALIHARPHFFAKAIRRLREANLFLGAIDQSVATDFTAIENLSGHEIRFRRMLEKSGVAFGSAPERVGLAARFDQMTLLYQRLYEATREVSAGKPGAKLALDTATAEFQAHKDSVMNSPALTQLTEQLRGEMTEGMTFNDRYRESEAIRQQLLGAFYKARASAVWQRLRQLKQGRL